MKALFSIWALAACLLGTAAGGGARAWGAARGSGVGSGVAGANVAQAAGTGFLDLASEPPGAKILIDDADLGQRTPQHHLAVPSGHHRLTLVPTDGAHKPLTLGITVEAGETRKLTLYLQK